MKPIIFLVFFWILSACGSLHQLSSTNCDCVGEYSHYQLAESPNIFTPDLCYLHTSGGTFIVIARDIWYDEGEILYLCRRLKIVPGEIFSAPIHQIESGESKYIYTLNYP